MGTEGSSILPIPPGLISTSPGSARAHSLWMDQCKAIRNHGSQRRIYRWRERWFTGFQRPDIFFVLCLPGRNRRSSNESQGRRSDNNYRGKSPRAGRGWALRSCHRRWRGRNLGQQQVGIAHPLHATVLLGPGGEGRGCCRDRGRVGAPAAPAQCCDTARSARQEFRHTAVPRRLLQRGPAQWKRIGP